MTGNGRVKNYNGCPLMLMFTAPYLVTRYRYGTVRSTSIARNNRTKLFPARLAVSVLLKYLSGTQCLLDPDPSSNKSST